ncbi:nucleotidyltransferase domain-containing protein [Lachnospiraceae bacterium MD308]|nr:nucleotidyltransferase domain-containing protein [Lachnospiraceae bacterium MD308]MCI8580266.1 nucleotidyltransferase domain-containing protein [Dorea sp.]
MEKTGIKKVVMEEILNLAKKHGIKELILFGSRARGDFNRASDIDLAARGGDICRFALDVEDETSTPLRYDVVDLDRNVQEDLRKMIETEGVVLYEKV